MKQIAVSIVIIPPDDILKKIIALNHCLTHKSASYAPLSTTDYIPHITLVMGTVRAKDFSAIKKALLKDLAGHHPLGITLTTRIARLKSDGVWDSHIAVRKTKDLKELHATAMRVMQPFLTGQSSELSFYAPLSSDDSALRWIKGFVHTSVYENYYPHITLGKGKAPKIKLPIRFIGTRIAICHLGTRCSCRKILFETTLA